MYSAVVFAVAHAAGWLIRRADAKGHAQAAVGVRRRSERKGGRHRLQASPMGLSGWQLRLVNKDLPGGLKMTTILFVIGVIIGALALVVLAALLQAVAAYLSARWRRLRLQL